MAKINPDVPGFRILGRGKDYLSESVFRSIALKTIASRKYRFIFWGVYF